MLNKGSKFKNLEYKSSEDSSLAVAVPSRLRFQGGKHPTLNGLRFAVKDNYHVAGVKTSLGNKAYFDTFPPQPETAECIQTIIDNGGVLLGKTKMNSLGTWEEPTEYIDYQAPWNSRADGYQGTGGSSTGSAAAIANYDWIDLALGSDSKFHALESRWRNLNGHSLGKYYETSTLVGHFWLPPDIRRSIESRSRPEHRVLLPRSTIK
jgi:hypothetical protein